MLRPKLVVFREAKNPTKQSIAAVSLLLGVSADDVESFVKKSKQVRKPVDLIGKYEQTIAQMTAKFQEGIISREYLDEKRLLENRISELTLAVDELRESAEPMKRLISELSKPWLECADYFKKKNRHASTASTGFFREQTIRVAKQVNNIIKDNDEVQD